MPSLQSNGRIRLTGAEQVAIIVRGLPKPEVETRKRGLPSYMLKFQREHGGYFRYKYATIQFVITDRRKFAAKLREKLKAAEFRAVNAKRRKEIAELKDQVRDAYNYAALLKLRLERKQKR